MWELAPKNIGRKTSRMDRKTTKSFNEQLRKAFIKIILIPVLSLGGFIFYGVFSSMDNQRMLESQNVIDQNLLDLGNRIDACNSSLRYLSANYSLRELLSTNKMDYLNLSKKSKNVRELFYNVLITNPNIKSITLYSDLDSSVLGNLMKPMDQVVNEEWYKNVMESDRGFWWYEGSELYQGRKIMAAYPNKAIGIVKAKINKDIFAESFNIFHGMPIQIIIQDGPDSLYMFKDTNYSDNARLNTKEELGIQDWTINYRIDYKYYRYNALINFLLVVTIIFLVLILVWTLIEYYSKKLTKELYILVENVQEAQNGNLDVEIQPSTITELNILAESIQNFLNKIKLLVRQVYVKEIERKSLELDLLQSKINPHFLYNNLSAINWLALRSGQDKIHKITTELATFYRTALNKGKNVDKLFVEIENIKSYINLQRIAHDDSFNVEYKINDKFLEYKVPIFILQPLVENSIQHGIELLREGEGEIQISVEVQGEWMYIEVYDNGTELFKKIGKATLPKEEFGYGTWNVYKRIQLLYGPESGLDIEADEKGTRAKVYFKFDHLNQVV